MEDGKQISTKENIFFNSFFVQVKLFRHLHGLSLRWHLSRETGEVLQLMDRGANSVGSLLDWLVFDIIPTLLDIIFALGYFVTGFGHWFGFLVLAIMALHVGKL